MSLCMFFAQLPQIQGAEAHSGITEQRNSGSRKPGLELKDLEGSAKDSSSDAPEMQRQETPGVGQCAGEGGGSVQEKSTHAEEKEKDPPTSCRVGASKQHLHPEVMASHSDFGFRVGCVRSRVLRRRWPVTAFWRCIIRCSFLAGPTISATCCVICRF